MPRCLIVYFSQGGTTARAAASIASGLRGAEWQVDLCNLKDGKPPSPSGYDLIGIGSPAYYFRPPFNVTDYLEGMPDLQGLAYFSFVLHGTYRGDTGTIIRQALNRKGAREVGYWHCLGDDYFLGYLKQGYLFSPEHPTAHELAEAEKFGHDVASRLAGEPYVSVEKDRPPAAIQRLERFVTNRWLARHLHSRLFTVNREKCSACGICMRLCPTGNISKNRDAQPVWGRNCLLCLTCEMKCPKDAINSPVSLPVFTPFLVYNVSSASRDPSLEHVRVIHGHGRTQRA